MPTKAPTPTPAKFTAGFTFMEVMLVILLFSLMAGVAAPEFFAAIEKHRTKELRHMIRVVRMLRNDAILQQNRYSIVFDPAEQEFIVEKHLKDGGIVQIDAPRLLRPHKYPEGFRLENVELRVDEEGRAYRGGGGPFGREVRRKVSVEIDSSGFVSPFTLYFLEEEQPWLIYTKGITGDLELVEGKKSAFR